MRLIDADDKENITIVFDSEGRGIIKRIDAPTVQAIPIRTGHWIINTYPAHECVYCSNCKEEYYEDDLYLGGSEFPNYCPNCGARMESEEV